MEDIYYENQRLFCETNKVPFFASSSCSHQYGWNKDRSNYGKRQTLGEILIERYGEKEAFKISASTHITSCPGCGRSWCD
jgi:hypothetical protein